MNIERIMLDMLKFLWKDMFFKIAVVVIVLALLIHIGLLVFTRFERKITIESNTTFGAGGGRSVSVSNMVSDKQGRVYKVRNVPLLLQFRAAEVQAALKAGETYTVRGYGIRVPIIGMYPTIYAVK